MRASHLLHAVAVTAAGIAAATHAEIVGFVGDTTLEGGWYAFEDEFDVEMTVIYHGGAPYESVISIEVPEFGGSLDFDAPHSLRIVGYGWASWGHGYDGEVFYTNGLYDMGYDLNMQGVGAFDTYLNTNVGWGDYAVTAYGSEGGKATVEFDQYWSAPAIHFGFYSPDEELLKIEITSNYHAWAIGEWRVGVPGPGTLALSAVPALALLGRRARSGEHRIHHAGLAEASGAQPA